MTAQKLVENFFRHEYGRLVATLSRRVGVEHLEAVEDAAQSALLKALDAWTQSEPPRHATAWLFRVARNELIDELRRRSGRRRILQQFAGDLQGAPEFEPDAQFSGEVGDDLLRMLFACCDETIPSDSQVVLALKSLCGFSIGEIATRLFTTEPNVYKRLTRARAKLMSHPPEFGDLSTTHYSSRVPTVRRVLYTMFTEGYLSSGAEFAIRRDLCEEAIRLATILAEHPVGQRPETYALLALMHLHMARMSARQDAGGGLLLLEEQDRALWDRQRIHVGLEWLEKSSQGELFSRYHAEAGIAAEHCLAPSIAETRWERVVECYQLLEMAAPSPIHRLNRAVAIAEYKGPKAGLAALSGLVPPTWLEGSYLWAAVLADLHRRAENAMEAEEYREKALRLAPTPAVRELLERRLTTASTF